jgi:hypothetical protein
VACCPLRAAYLLPLGARRLGATGLLACLAAHVLLLSALETAITHSVETHSGWPCGLEGGKEEGEGEEDEGEGEGEEDEGEGEGEVLP